MSLRAVPKVAPAARRSLLLGRQSELEHVLGFVAEPGAPDVLVLEGSAGIGKTALWQRALETAAAHGDCVLSCRCAEEETALGFQGLADLFEGLEPDLLEGLTPPKRKALEAALLLGVGGEMDERAARAGATDLLRSATTTRRLVIAIDDWPWLDPETLSVLRFSARRLRGEPIKFLLTVRTNGHPGKPEVPDLGLPTERLKLLPLSFTTIAQLLHAALGVRLARTTLRDLYELSEGNPLFALQLARAASEQPTPDGARRSLPLPERLQATMADRISGISDSVRAALLAVACSHTITVGDMRELFSLEVIEDAVGAGILSTEGDRIRLAHPLFGEVALRLAAPAGVREVHRRLAEVTNDPERRALHLADASIDPSSEVAALLESAAVHAARRAAVSTAAALSERASRLTPREDEQWVPRLLLAAEYSNRAGELRKTDALLAPHVDQLPPGPTRALARYLLADASPVDAWTGLRLALEDVPEPTALRATILATLAAATGIGRCRLTEAESYAREALSIAGTAHGEAPGAASLMWIQAMRGRRVERRPCDPGQLELGRTTLRINAVAQMWRGELARARQELERLTRLADERGEGESYFQFRHHRCELELRAARWPSVEELLAEVVVERGEAITANAALLGAQAHLSLGRGQGAEASRLAEASINAAALDASAGIYLEWQRLEALRILGAAQLLERDAEAASATLMQVWEHTEREGIHNPGTFPVAPDLVEALSLSGRIEEARSVAHTLRTRAAEQDHPWGRAAAACAAGQVALAQRDDAAAAAAFEEAVSRFAELSMPLDQGRALTHLGVAQRRLRRRREARATLEAAARLLTELGSTGWVVRAMEELRRIAGRRASGQGLTPTENRVAELVAIGLGNKQIAVALTISVSAVEAHLTRIYNKLGVRSRTELAAVVSHRASASSTSP
jgi:DNA-binding CsgD family transcriptional regulator